MRASFCVAGVLAAFLGAVSCASPAELYVINETGQPLKALFASDRVFNLAAQPYMQTVRFFPEYDWTLTAGSCVYRYPAIAAKDPAWIEYAEQARASGAGDLLVRVGRDFTVRAYSYDRRSEAMMGQEIKIGGLPMTPMKTCAGEP
jgi:hypothetical protein